MILEKSYKFFLLFMILTSTLSHSQSVIKPNFKFKTVNISEENDNRSTFINYPDLTKKEEDSLFSKREQEILDRLIEQNKSVKKYISRDKKVREEQPISGEEKPINFSFPLEK